MNLRSWKKVKRVKAKVEITTFPSALNKFTLRYSIYLTNN